MPLKSWLTPVKFQWVHGVRTFYKKSERQILSEKKVAIC